MTPLEKLQSLDGREQTAFLALFAGARGSLQLMYREVDMVLHRTPSFGKAECECVPFHDFWRDKLPALGFTTYEESEPFPLPGAVPGHVGTRVLISVTDEGRAASEAYWADWNDQVDAIAAARAERLGQITEPEE
jgi:hypothetical protein